jgi:hypothetical protein
VCLVKHQSTKGEEGREEVVDEDGGLFLSEKKGLFKNRHFSLTSGVPTSDHTSFIV